MKHARHDYNRIQDPENLIPKDEPVFLMRGQDRIASFVTKLWAIVNFVTGGSRDASRLAWIQARKMKHWCYHKPCDLPGER